MKKFSINSIVIQLFLSHVMFLLLLVLFGSGLGRGESYLVAFISSVSSLMYLSYQFYRFFKINILFITLTGVCVKLLIGYIFWQFYIWPDYFFNPSSSIEFDHYEYLFTPRSMEVIAEYRIDHGFFSVPLEVDYMGKYFYIYYVMSNLYFSGNANLLDISIQNTLFSVYTAIIISVIAMKFGLNRLQIKTIFIIALFQPFSFISAMMWRDTVGQFFVMFGFYLLLSSFNAKTIKAVTTLLAASLSMALLRTVYVFLPVLLYFLRCVKVGVSVKQVLILLVLITIVVTSILSTNLIELLIYGYSSYLSDLSNFKFILFLPLDYIRSLLGPFPWINWFQFNDNTIFLIGNYFQAVYVLVTLYFTVRYYKSSAGDFKFFIALFFFMLLTMSLVTDDVHTEYFTFSAALLLPISAKYLTVIRFLRVYGIVFMGFIFLNILYLSLGLHGAGLGVSS